MIKGYVKEGWLFFYVSGDEMENTTTLQTNLLRQVSGMYGKVIKIGKVLAVKPGEEYLNYENNLLRHIVREFRFILNEFERLEPAMEDESIEIDPFSKVGN
jgi:hypothetical protein